MGSNLKKAALFGGGLAVIVAVSGVVRYRGIVSADVVDENREMFYKALAAEINCPQRLVETKYSDDQIKARDFSSFSVSCNGQSYGQFRVISRPSEDQPWLSFITKYDVVKVEKM